MIHVLPFDRVFHRVGYSLYLHLPCSATGYHEFSIACFFARAGGNVGKRHHTSFYIACLHLRSRRPLGQHASLISLGSLTASEELELNTEVVSRRNIPNYHARNTVRQVFLAPDYLRQGFLPPFPPTLARYLSGSQRCSALGEQIGGHRPVANLRWNKSSNESTRETLQ